MDRILRLRALLEVSRCRAHASRLEVSRCRAHASRAPRAHRVSARILPIVVALVATGTASFAQNINKFVLSDEAARKALIKYEISGDVAEKITQACVDFAKKNNMAVSVFILSPTGQIVHAHRMDGQVPINIETARLKAESVLYTRDSSHARSNTVANNLSLQLRWANLPVFPVSGGLPIIVDNQMIGAIGVGGSNKDEECAHAALTSVVGPQPPLASFPLPPQQPAR